MKLSPEELKERKNEYNKQYRLEKKELLKEKRKEKNKERKRLSPPKPRLIKPPRKIPLTPEERKEWKKEYYKKKWGNMTVEEKKKIYENIVRRNLNLTEEQREERKVKRKESHKIRLQNMTEEQRNKTITPH